MSKIVTTIAVLMLALAASSSAAGQDFRSPDAQPAIVNQDYRSPDAQPATRDPGTPSVRPAPGRPGYVVQDGRSPDAVGSVPSAPAAPSVVPHGSSSLDWGYLALGIAAALILVGGFALTHRRRRHGLAIGN